MCEFSSGQYTSIALVILLLTKPDILLLDEPVSGLDPKATAMMYEIINKLNKEDGMTIIMISHDLNGSLKYASNVLNVGEK